LSLNEQELQALKSPIKTHMMPEYSEPKNYYELYWELYLQNESLIAKVCAESLERD
jgi:hypothetical protein